MNREEMKKMLPIIQAYIDGKAIEHYNKNINEWTLFDKDHSFFITLFDNPGDYRIKPEPKYRPFKDAEECWNEMLKHQPFGWVKGSFGEYATIDFIDECGTARHGKATWNFKKSFDEVTFADGSVFGVKDE